MKKCPNCGRILHDDSIFCFGCMSEINKRQEIVLATPKTVADTNATAIIGVVIFAFKNTFLGYILIITIVIRPRL